VGASTGGFVDCLLQAEGEGHRLGLGRAARSVARNERVHVIEGMKQVSGAEALRGSGSLTWTFLISVAKVASAVLGCYGRAFVESSSSSTVRSGPRDVGKGGIVRDGRCIAGCCARREFILGELRIDLAGVAAPRCQDGGTSVLLAPRARGERGSLDTLESSDELAVAGERGRWKGRG